LVNFIIPGLGPLVRSVGDLGGNVINQAEKVYDAYHCSKKEGNKFKFKDGVQTFFSDPDDLSDVVKSIIKDLQNLITPTQNRPPEAVMNLTKAYGDLHPKLKLKEDSE
jgi:hypothetical protein